jgi:hypothetical protein
MILSPAKVLLPAAEGLAGSKSIRNTLVGRRRAIFTDGKSVPTMVKTLVTLEVMAPFGAVSFGVTEGSPLEVSNTCNDAISEATPMNGTLRAVWSAGADEATIMYPEYTGISDALNWSWRANWAVKLPDSPGPSSSTVGDRVTEIGVLWSIGGGKSAGVPLGYNTYAVAALTLPRLYVTELFAVFAIVTICVAWKFAVS